MYHNVEKCGCTLIVTTTYQPITQNSMLPPSPPNHPTCAANPPEPIVLLLQGMFEGKRSILQQDF